MLFNSLPFLGFLALLLLAYRLAPARARQGLLLLASYAFYAGWDWRFLPLLWASTLLDFWVGRQMAATQEPRARKRLLGISLAGNLLPLAFFKYYGFLLRNALDAAAWLAGTPPAGEGLWTPLLPVGISFYTFQTLSYTIDLYRGQLEPAKSLRQFALYVAFFPQLVAGPIEKARDLMPQLRELPPLRGSNLRYGLPTLLYGLFCKAVAGDACGKLSDAAFREISAHTPLESLLGAFLFSVQIYMDFAGYSLMALGLARCFGVRLSDNFRQPYLASSITDFWRRWHLSLSSWLKEYVYIPMGGNRRGRLRQYAHLMATMLVGGLWHGASWTFVAWGAGHGLLLALHKLLAPALGLLPEWLRRWGGPPLTFLLVTALWVCFRAATLAEAGEILGRIAWRLGEGGWESPLWQPLLWSLALVLANDLLQRHYRTHLFLLKWPRPIQYGVMAAMALVIVVLLLPSKPQPFIYFQF